MRGFMSKPCCATKMVLMRRAVSCALCGGLATKDGRWLADEPSKGRSVAMWKHVKSHALAVWIN